VNGKPLASDIYERLEMNANGEGGSVASDIADIVADGDYDAFEDYFGDTDPFEYL
jgi:hypothetical protein